MNIKRSIVNNLRIGWYEKCLHKLGCSFEFFEDEVDRGFYLYLEDIIYHKVKKTILKAVKDELHKD